MIGTPSLSRTTQTSRVSSSYSFPSQQTKVCFDWKGGYLYRQAAFNQNRRQSPHRRYLPCRLHGCVHLSLYCMEVDLEFYLDVISIEKSGEHFRLLYDVKGRFTIHRITPEEATYKLLKVRRVAIGSGAVPHVVTHDGRTIRYPDPAIKANDTVKYDFEQGKITDFVKFDTGNIVMVTGGRNMGRAGVIVHREKHIGGFDIVHVKDSLDRTFATRYVYLIVFHSDKLMLLPQCHQHFCHRRRHQALDIFTQGQRYQAYHIRGERCQEKKSGGAVKYSSFSFPHLSSVCLSPTYKHTPKSVKGPTSQNLSSSHTSTF